MKNNFIFFIGLWSMIFASSCNSENKPIGKNNSKAVIDSFDSALPHGSTLSNAELTDEDKLKLAKALGKKAISISLDSLQNIIKNDSSGWCLYNFWNLDCAACLSVNESLKTISANPDGPSKLNIKYVNTIGLYTDQVNTYIRENGIIDEVYTIPTDTLTDWSNEIYPVWNGDLPALLFINNTEGTRLFYQQTFSKEELQAILETLTL